MGKSNVDTSDNVLSSDFAAWLRIHRVAAHGTQAAFVAEGWRGIAATEDISAGALLLQVPEEILMTTNSAAREEDFNTASKRECDLSPEQVLIAHLLHEVSKGVKSQWHPYIAQLPHAYTLMMNFGPEHLKALQTPYAQQVASASCQQAQDLWKATKGLLTMLGLPKKWCSLKAWLWASSTVCSRTMHVPFSSAGALTPFGDLHNYHPPPPPHYPEIEGVSACSHQDRYQNDEDYGDGGYSESFKEYCLYARKQYRRGEQVFLCYGKYTNLELLEHYGFVLADNPHDEATLPLSALPPAFVTYLQQHRSPGHCFLHCNGIPSWQLLQDLRCYAATPLERKQMGHLAVGGERISIAGDTVVFKLLRCVCETVLSQLSTSLGEDEELLQRPAADECMHAAISWRTSYKRCLHAGVRVADEALIALTSLAAPS